MGQQRAALRRAATAIVAVLAGAAAAWSMLDPSNTRDWSPDHARLPIAEFDGDLARIRNVRNFSRAADGVPIPAYEERVYDLSRLESVWFVLTPFSKDWRGPAHAFLSFGFADSQYVAVSVEARRERGETYSVLKGALKRFEILYVIGDERDMIGGRAARGDDVYLYPIRATHEQTRALFDSMLRRANELNDRPEFYGSFLNNCTTNILRHVNAIATRAIPYGPRIFLPGYSDALAHERGLIDTELPLEEARRRFHISEVAQRNSGAADFSIRIRNRFD
jgi:hypothetical protein